MFDEILAIQAKLRRRARIRRNLILAAMACVTATAIVLTVGQACAQTALKPGELNQYSVEITQFENYVKGLPTDRRDKMVDFAVGAGFFNERCSELPPRIRLFVAGAIGADPVRAYKSSTEWNLNLRVISNAEFCDTVRPGIEAMKRSLGS